MKKILSLLIIAALTLGCEVDKYRISRKSMCFDK